MKTLIVTLILALGLATVAGATMNNGNNDCPGNSCHGGAGGAGGDGGDGGNAAAVAGGGDGGNATSSATGGQARGGDATSVAGSSSSSGAAAGAISGAAAGAASNDSIVIDDHANYKYTEATVAPGTTAASAAVDNICGNVSGTSGSGGVFGGGFSRPSVECQIHKHLLFQQAHAGTPAARFEMFCFWFPSTVIVRLALAAF